MTFATAAAAAEGRNVDDVDATLRGGLVAGGNTADEDGLEEGGLRCDSVVINARASVSVASFL